VHRQRQRDAPLESTAAVAAAVAALYAHVYGVGPEKVQLAAGERAAAVRISDRWVQDCRDPVSPALVEERAALVRSYSALLAAVHGRDHGNRRVRRRLGPPSAP
jgi:hypothetical protein